MPDPREEAPDRRAGAPSRESKVRKGQTSASYELRRQTCFSQMTDFPVSRMPTVGRQTPQLCARKVGTHLGIASTRRVEPNPAPLATTMTGTSSMRRYDRPALRVQPLEPIAKRSVGR